MIEQLSAIHPLLPAVAGSLALLFLAVIGDLVAKRLLLVAVRAVVRRTRYKGDDALLDHNVFGRLAQIVPAIIIYFGIGLVADYPEAIEKVVRNVSSAYMVIMLMLTLTATMSAANQIYETRRKGDRITLRGPEACAGPFSFMELDRSLNQSP